MRMSLEEIFLQVTTDETAQPPAAAAPSLPEAEPVLPPVQGGAQ
jgi:hypothetical protein